MLFAIIQMLTHTSLDMSLMAASVVARHSCRNMQLCWPNASDMFIFKCSVKCKTPATVADQVLKWFV